MSPRLIFRLAAVVLLLFAAGHTAGFLTFRPPTAEGRAVLNAMDTVHFTMGSDTFSYGNFYRGFGLFITVFQLFAAWLAWLLSAWFTQLPKQVRMMAYGLCTVQIVSLGLALKYFSTVPAIMSAAAAILLAVAARSTKAQVP